MRVRESIFNFPKREAYIQRETLSEKTRDTPVPDSSAVWLYGTFPVAGES